MCCSHSILNAVRTQTDVLLSCWRRSLAGAVLLSTSSLVSSHSWVSSGGSVAAVGLVWQTSHVRWPLWVQWGSRGLVNMGFVFRKNDWTPNCVMHFCCGPDDDFQLMQRTFMEKHYQAFDDSEENKLIYTCIFNEYVRYYFPGFCMYYFLLFLRPVSDPVFPPLWTGFVWSTANMLPAISWHSHDLWTRCFLEAWFLAPFFTSKFLYMF